MSACFRRVGEQCKKLYASVELSRFVTLGCLVVYSLLGAGVFFAIENGPDTLARQQTIQVWNATQEQLLQDLWLLDKEDFATFATQADKLIANFTNGIGASAPEPVSHWDLWNALLFSGTIYTTIGYGNFACETAWGKVFTLIYAIFGIPLALVTLNDVGTLLLRTMARIQKCIERCFAACENAARRVRKGVWRKSKKPKNYPSYIAHIDEATVTIDITTSGSVSEVEEIEEDENSTDVSVLMALFSTIFWIFLCSTIFCVWEDWSFGKSFYFFFISLTTIGLGDVTADDPKHMVIVFGLVIVGLAMVSVCINSIQNAMEKLYVAIMMKILKEYSRQLACGQDEMNASLGMMQMFQGSMKGKVANMLLSNDKKKVVLQKVEEEAEAEGLVVPEIFHHCDPKSGLPDFISSPKEAIKAEKQQIEEREKDPEAFDLKRFKRPATADAEAQTNDVIVVEKREKKEKTELAVQTVDRQSKDFSVQTSDTVVARHRESADIETQTSVRRSLDISVQAEKEKAASADNQSQTFVAAGETVSTQTADVQIYDKRFSADMEIQAGSTPLVHAASSQTLFTATETTASQTLDRSLSEISMQTVHSEMLDTDAQTITPPLTDVIVQTSDLECESVPSQTSVSWFSSKEAQCQSVPESAVVSSQTLTAVLNSALSQTHAPESCEGYVQVTPEVSFADVQAGCSLIDRLEQETQTEKIVRRSSSTMEKNLAQFEQSAQRFKGLRKAPLPAIETRDDWRVKLRSTPVKKFVELSSTQDVRSKSDAEDSEEEEHKEIVKHVASTAKLRWDPFDGRHVEEQKPVHKLKSFFDKREEKQVPKPGKLLKRRSTTFVMKPPPSRDPDQQGRSSTDS